MDYINILKFVSLKLSPAIVVGMLLLMYFKKKLNEKADKLEIENLKLDIKKDFSDLKNEFIKTLKEKLDASSGLILVTIERVETVFEVQNQKMQQIVDIQIKAINDHISKLEKNIH